MSGLADNDVARGTVTWLATLCLLLTLGIPAGSQTQQSQNSAAAESSKTQDSSSPVSEDKALAGKKELSKTLLSDPSVIGVGVGSFHSSPIIYVYVIPKVSKETLGRIPKKYEGVPVSVVKSEPIKPTQ